MMTAHPEMASHVKSQTGRNEKRNGKVAAGAHWQAPGACGGVETRGFKGRSLVSVAWNSGFEDKDSTW